MTKFWYFQEDRVCLAAKSRQTNPILFQCPVIIVIANEVKQSVSIFDYLPNLNLAFNVQQQIHRRFFKTGQTVQETRLQHAFLFLNTGIHSDLFK